MSLINDALKKAQRQRAEEQVAYAPMPGGGSAYRAKNGKQTLILMGAGAAVLVAVSVVFTVHILSSAVDSKTAAKAGASTPVAATVAPVVKAAVDTKPVAPLVVVVQPPKAPVVATPDFAASGPVILTDSLKSDEEIQTMVDKYKVSGVRTGGTKVLMNDHIVRVNEIVDRETGLRLVKIEDDMLIFKDAKGTLYTKNF